MNEPQRFKNAIQALVLAFFDETLAKGNCAACAVGNIVAHAYDKRLESTDPKGVECKTIPISTSKYGVVFHAVPNTYWNKLFSTSYIGAFKSHIQNRRRFSNIEEVHIALDLIKPTGYTEDELAAVEYAFEINTKIHFVSYEQHTQQEIMEDQYNGLCAVFKVLCELDGLDYETYKEYLAYDEELKPVNAFQCI